MYSSNYDNTLIESPKVLSSQTICQQDDKPWLNAIRVCFQSGRGAGSTWGIAPPRLPQIRTCPIKASGSSRRGLVVPRVYPQVMVRRVLRFDALHVVHSYVPQRGTHSSIVVSISPRRSTSSTPTALNAARPSLPRVPKVRSPASTVLWRAPNPQRPSRRTSFPSLGDIIV